MAGWDPIREPETLWREIDRAFAGTGPDPLQEQRSAWGGTR